MDAGELMLLARPVRFVRWLQNATAVSARTAIVRSDSAKILMRGRIANAKSRRFASIFDPSLAD
jgi:hypothetical protein